MIDARRSLPAALLAFAVTCSEPVPTSLAALGVYMLGTALGTVLLTLAYVDAMRIRRERKAGR